MSFFFYAILFLAEATIPLALEGGGAAILTAMQQSNSREIVQSLTADADFIRAVIAGLRAPVAPTPRPASPGRELPPREHGFFFCKQTSAASPPQQGREARVHQQGREARVQTRAASPPQRGREARVH